MSNSLAHYEAVFIGGGLSSLMLLRAMGRSAPTKIAVIEPRQLESRKTTHWSYWSDVRRQSYYDQFAS